MSHSFFYTLKTTILGFIFSLSLNTQDAMASLALPTGFRPQSIQLYTRNNIEVLYRDSHSNIVYLFSQELLESDCPESVHTDNILSSRLVLPTIETDSMAKNENAIYFLKNENILFDLYGIRFTHTASSTFQSGFEKFLNYLARITPFKASIIIDTVHGYIKRPHSWSLNMLEYIAGAEKSSEYVKHAVSNTTILLPSDYNFCFLSRYKDCGKDIISITYDFHLTIYIRSTAGPLTFRLHGTDMQGNRATHEFKA